MNNIKKERKTFKLFNKTESGASKLVLFVMGIILGIVSSTLFGYMCGNYNATGDYRYYDWLLFVAIFLLILTGELIGIYFGAYEEFHLMEKQKNVNQKEDEKKDIALPKDNVQPIVQEEKKNVVKTTRVTRKKNDKKTPKKARTSSSKSTTRTTKRKSVEK